MLKKKWLLKSMTSCTKEISRKLKISEISAKVLVERGIDTEKKAHKFLFSEYQDLHSPWLLPDIKPAIMRIKTALAAEERITVYGDYDVDGQTSVVLLVNVLRSLAVSPSQVDYYIPNRVDEGYGLHENALEEIVKTSSLVITVDCGTNACSEAIYAKANGLDLIITDHHEVGKQLPEAVAVINPKRSDSQYPCKHLAGVGVAYKLVQALGETNQQDFSHWLDLVALGTVSDLVPLVDENRIFVKLGLVQMERTLSIGLEELKKVCGLSEPYKAADLGFKLGPRLNAVGRMGESSRAVELLLTDNRHQARMLAQELDKENKSRQITEADILAQAITQVEKNSWNKSPVIVVADKRWHPGVIGIVASRLVERYYRPTIVIAINEEVGKGSGRSISGFNLYDGLAGCSDLLEQFGGHEMAAGLTISEEKIAQFRERLSDLAEEKLKPEDFIPKVKIDAKLSIDGITDKFFEELQLLEPFGMGNPRPIFQFSGSVVNLRPVGNDRQHLHCCIQDHTGLIEAIGFDMYQAAEDFEKHREQTDFAAYPQQGFRNPSKYELVLRDVRFEEDINTYIDHWMIEQYPWQLQTEYHQISHLNNWQPHCPTMARYNLIDKREIWNKEKELIRLLDPDKRVLIYVANPQRALELCRTLRIVISQGEEFIGFEHELLSPDEQQELALLLSEERIAWVVSTGICNSQITWDQVVLYDAFCTPTLLEALTGQITRSGDLITIYGRKDCAWMQGKLQSKFPSRDLLAKFYLALIGIKKEKLTVEALEQVAHELHLSDGLRFILGVFQELSLLKVEGSSVFILPKPAKKLDLNTSVLYNKGMNRRKQYLDYLQCILEGGFFYEPGKNYSCN